MLLVPLKILLFVYILTRFKLRSRTSMLGSFNLGNFSEFGLIVAAVATYKGWLPPEWLVIIAVALSFSFYSPRHLTPPSVISTSDSSSV